MPGSSNGDGDQRKNTTVDNSTEMTIEFLRARLLSERSVSRAARQRADGLAKRVAELEEQLQIVSLQRKKAEKATAVVLAILENHGISDVSEAFDSSSDQEVSHHESKVGNSSVDDEETSASVKLKRNGMEAFSNTELESSPLTGRSLSWKSTKNSPHFREKSYIDSSRRRRSRISSTGSSSPKHVGISCRQIRRRETGSDVEEIQSACVRALQHDGIANSSEELHNCSKIQPGISGEGAEKVPVTEAFEDQRRLIGNQYINGQEGEGDMESALEHQAQLIGQYEAEEKAQREWEEKFKENNISTLDSVDPGNDSDVTEEREDVDKALAAEAPSETISSQDRVTEIGAPDICSKEESKTPNGFCPPMHVNMGYLQNQTSSSTPAQESPTSEFAFPTAKAVLVEEGLEYIKSPKGLVSHNIPYNHLAGASHAVGSHHREDASGIENELAFVPQTSNKLQSVLGALQQAKLSLEQKINQSSIVEGGPVVRAIMPSVPNEINHLSSLDDRPVGIADLPFVPNKINQSSGLQRGPVGTAMAPYLPEMKNGDRWDVTVGCAGLFRVPTDYQLEATSKFNFRGSGSQLDLVNYSPEIGPALTAGDKFLTSSLESSSRASAGDRFLTMPPRSSTEVKPGIPTWIPTLEPKMDAGLASSDGRMSPNLHFSAASSSFSRYSYPTYPLQPDLMPRRTPDGGLSRSLTTAREAWMPPPANFSLYEDHFRQNMHR